MDSALDGLARRFTFAKYIVPFLTRDSIGCGCHANNILYRDIKIAKPQHRSVLRFHLTLRRHEKRKRQVGDGEMEHNEVDMGSFRLAVHTVYHERVADSADEEQRPRNNDPHELNVVECEIFLKENLRSFPRDRPAYTLLSSLDWSESDLPRSKSMASKCLRT